MMRDFTAPCAAVPRDHLDVELSYSGRVLIVTHDTQAENGGHGCVALAPADAKALTAWLIEAGFGPA